MIKNISIILFLLLINLVSSQEFLADVQVNYSQVQTGNTQVYKTLEKSLQSFINNTKWTDKEYKSFEKIRCSFSIIINSHPSSDKFEGTIIVQYHRPVFDSTYYSPIININDTKFDFFYTEYEPLIFNERKYSGKNLTDVIGYYVYLILGFDGDSFSINGGEPYFLKSKNIADISQNQSLGGWNLIDGYKSRGSLITDYLKPQNSELRKLIYNYHRLGLDQISTNELGAKNKIFESINNSLPKFQNTFQFYALDIFLSTKKQELVDIFSGGNSISGNISTLKQTLNQISPINSEYWDKIKN